jgi:hypothetical protein
MQCPLCGGEVAEHGPYVVLLEDRDGAGNESTGSHFAGGGEKDHAMVGSRKNGGRDGAVGDELKPDISFATKRGHF